MMKNLKIHTAQINDFLTVTFIQYLSIFDCKIILSGTLGVCSIIGQLGIIFVKIFSLIINIICIKMIIHIKLNEIILFTRARKRYPEVESNIPYFYRRY